MAKSGWKGNGTAMFRWPVKLSSAALIGVAASLLFAQEEPTFRTNVNLVRVTATVKNRAGELVGTLHKEDFDIYDNGVRQEIGLFQRQTEQPLSVALIMDTSGSTAKEMPYEIKSAAGFLHALLGEGNPEDA